LRPIFIKRMGAALHAAAKRAQRSRSCDGAACALAQHHQRQALLGGERISMQEVLDAAGAERPAAAMSGAAMSSSAGA